MPVETFTATEFQAALPAGWRCVGYEQGELTYRLPTIGDVEIVVRSSIRMNGASAGVGEDSIRAWLVASASGAPISHKVNQHTTRVSGWQGRLGKVIQTLTQWRRVAGDCPKCQRAKGIYQSQTDKNPGRMFAKCGQCEYTFEWLDSPRSQPYYAPTTAKATAVTNSEDEPENDPNNKRLLESLSSELGTGVTPTPGNRLASGTTVDVSPVLSLDKLSLDDLDDPASPRPAGLIEQSPVVASPVGFLSKRAAVRLTQDEIESESDLTAAPTGKSEFVPSRYQEAIYEWLKAGKGNGVVIATAGSGKTSTLKHAAPHLPSGAKIAAIAFGKRNAADLQRALPDVHASTFHSLGLSNVKRAMPSIKVDADKTWHYLRQIENGSGSLAEVVSENGADIKHLIDLVKSTMAGSSDADLARVCDRYGIALNGSTDAAFEITRRILTQSDNDTGMADFGDMLKWCAQGRVKSEKFDFLLCDEGQDATQAQIECQKQWLKPGGRLLSVGDPRQAIFGWAGSAIDSLEQVTRYHKAINLPLSISYRLPLSHVEYVNDRFPGANIEARPGAPEGEIKILNYGEMIRKAQPGDLVICRVNAPLVAPCFELIRYGRKATIAGRDIGKGLTVLLTRVEKKHPGSNLRQLFSALRDYAEREIGKLLAARKNNQASTLSDQVDTLLALSDGAHTTGDIRRKVEAVFSDDAKGVIFSSGHRAKGSEAEHVYYFHPELVPHRLAVEKWQLQAESNIDFVMSTRSKHGLYFTSGN